MSVDPIEPKGIVLIKKAVLAALAAIMGAGAANAAIITFQGTTANGPNDFTFSYGATLGPDEGMRHGDQIVIFDFAGYIAGSIFSGSSDFALSVENSSPTALRTMHVLLSPGL